MERGAEQGVRSEEAVERRTVQLLTAHVLMLALDEDQTVEDSAVEVVRVSRGELPMLYKVHERVRRLAATHPGQHADRALAIIEAATERVDSLQRHPTSARVIDRFS